MHQSLVKAEEQRHLLQYLGWFIRLRWVAGMTVVLGALSDHLLFQWYPARLTIAALGFVILAYNAILWLILRRIDAGGRVRFHVMAWVQLLLDFAVLANLTVLTGGIMSP